MFRMGGGREKEMGKGSNRGGGLGNLYHSSIAERTIWRHDIMANKRG